MSEARQIKGYWLLPINANRLKLGETGELLTVDLVIFACLNSNFSMVALL